MNKHMDHAITLLNGWEDIWQTQKTNLDNLMDKIILIAYETNSDADRQKALTEIIALAYSHKSAHGKRRTGETR